MTTIAANRTQIAGDRQANHSGGLKFKLKSKLYSFNTPIIYKKPFHIGLCGNVDDFSSVIEFFYDPTAYKKAPRFKGEGLVLSEDGKIWTFGNDPSKWILVDQPYYSVGSGMNFAMGAMAAGSSPYDAVKYASTLCSATGMGATKIDVSP